MNLPNDYIEEMKSLLGEEEYLLYKKALDEKSHLAIRINTSKISADDFIKISPFKLTKVPFTDNGFYIEDTDAASKHPYYFAGLYYIQEPSAMVPASSADIKSSDKVLDLCAAPGGKATAVAAKNPALLIANDISFSRTIPLVKNLELFGAKNSCVICEDPQRLSHIYPGFFDKILIDAPCSGEGMFRKDSRLISEWTKKRPQEYAPLQKSILQSAVDMLSGGGDIIYSTCTFSKCEDEEVISCILKENPNLSIQSLKHYDGFMPGFSDEYDFSGAIRLFPHHIKGEGHFVCKLHKDEEGRSKEAATASSNIKTFSKDQLDEKIVEFLKYVRLKDDNIRYYINDGFVYLITPAVLKSLKKELHYARTGVMIGHLKGKNNFVPATGFALYLKNGEFANVLNLRAFDERIIKYLKGETIEAKEAEDKVNKGFVLICVDDFPLGFAKFDGFKYKNLYTPGWRLNC